MASRTDVLAHLRKSKLLHKVMANTGRLCKWKNPGPEHYAEMEKKRARQIRALTGAGSGPSPSPGAARDEEE